MELKVTTTGRYIVFSDQGPDTRYRKREFRIPIRELDEYLEAYRVNFGTYCRRKAEGETGIYTGLKQMKIYLDGLYEGVCLFGHYRPVKTEKQLQKILTELEQFR
jgi:hypothetical protein